jgi:hypothetical protein
MELFLLALLAAATAVDQAEDKPKLPQYKPPRLPPGSPGDMVHIYDMAWPSDLTTSDHAARALMESEEMPISPWTMEQIVAFSQGRLRCPEGHESPDATFSRILIGTEEVSIIDPAVIHQGTVRYDDTEGHFTGQAAHAIICCLERHADRRQRYFYFPRHLMNLEPA